MSCRESLALTSETGTRKWAPIQPTEGKRGSRDVTYMSLAGHIRAIDANGAASPKCFFETCDRHFLPPAADSAEADATENRQRRSAATVNQAEKGEQS